MGEGCVDDHGVGEQIGVRDDDTATIVGADEGGARLDFLDRALVSLGDDLIADAKRLRDQ